MVRRLFWITLLAGLAWWVLTRQERTWSPLQTTAGHFERRLNEVLRQLGVTDGDIRIHRREERRLGPLRWVVVQRTIDVTPSVRAAFQHRLSALSPQSGWSFRQQSISPQVTRWSIRKWFITLQRVDLVERATPKSAPISLAKSHRVAIVIDDVAYDLAQMDRYAALGVPLTFAVLPGSKRSMPLSKKATRLGFPVLLHLPLEPHGMPVQDPGPSALYLRMTEAERQRQFDKAVASVPDLVGINNHMGSAFTENEEGMDQLMRWVKAKHVFFLDSRTSSRSMAPRAARKAGVSVLVNHTFLDNQDDAAYIEGQLDRVMALAERYGQTVAIGHYRRKYLLEALTRKIPEFKSRHIEFVALPALVKP